MFQGFNEPALEGRSKLIRDLSRGKGRQSMVQALSLKDSDFSYVTYQLTTRPKNIPKCMEQKFLRRAVKLDSVRNSLAASSLRFAAGLNDPALFAKLLKRAQEILPMRVLDLDNHISDCTLRTLCRGTAAILARHLRANPQDFEKTFLSRKTLFLADNPKPLLLLLALRDGDIDQKILGDIETSLRGVEHPLAAVFSPSSHGRIQRIAVGQKADLEAILRMSIRDIRKDPSLAGLQDLAGINL